MGLPPPRPIPDSNLKSEKMSHKWPALTPVIFLNTGGREGAGL
jgi:hypothetical protein